MINLIKKELHQKVKTELNKNMNNIIFESIEKACPGLLHRLFHNLFRFGIWEAISVYISVKT